MSLASALAAALLQIKAGRPPSGAARLWEDIGAAAQNKRPGSGPGRQFADLGLRCIGRIAAAAGAVFAGATRTAARPALAMTPGLAFTLGGLLLALGRNRLQHHGFGAFAFTGGRLFLLWWHRAADRLGAREAIVHGREIVVVILTVGVLTDLI
jgi:hypothetical protein